MSMKAIDAVCECIGARLVLPAKAKPRAKSRKG